MSTATRWFLVLGLTTLGALSQVGCRACGTCYDYSPPVVGCECDACGAPGGRHGSALGHYAGGDEKAAESIATKPDAVDGPIVR